VVFAVLESVPVAVSTLLAVAMVAMTGKFWRPFGPGAMAGLEFALAPHQSPAEFTFVHASDTHVSEASLPRIRRLRALVDSLRPAFVLLTGDLVRDALRVAEPEARGRVLMDWNWQMPLGLCLSELELAAGDRARARLETERVCSQAARSGERTYLSLARRMLARLFVEEQDLPRALGEITAAVSALEGCEAPMAEWQVCATAADLSQRSGRTSDAQAFLERSARTIGRLADSLGAAPDLQRSFLSAPQVLAVTTQASGTAGHRLR